MGLDDNFSLSEDDIGGSAQPVKVSDIRIAIFENVIVYPNLGEQNFMVFAYCFPYKNIDGGKITIFNPTWPEPFRHKIYPTKELLFRAFKTIKADGLKKSPRMKTLYDGIIGRDGFHGFTKQEERGL